MRGPSKTRLTEALAVLVAVAVVAGGVADASGSGVLVSPRSESFVSLWQPPQPGSVAIEQFSLKSGRPLATLAVEPDSEASPPHPDRSGKIWITATTGPGCSFSHSHECGPPVPNSCTSTVTRLDPLTGVSKTVASFPSSQLVSDTIPSPRRGVVALLTGGCATSFFNQHLVVENLRSHKSWSIGADARDCHGLSEPAWNASGSQLVFAYAPSALRPRQRWPHGGAIGQSCLAPRAGHIALVSATHGSSARSWSLISPRAGCSYTSAAFDDQGIAAFEACAPGLHGPPSDDFLGPAFLVQLDPHGNILFRIALKLGANPGTVTSDPRTHVVLVSQDQTHTQPRPTQDWVWQLQGRHLRLIATYPFDGMAVVSAQPW